MSNTQRDSHGNADSVNEEQEQRPACEHTAHAVSVLGQRLGQILWTAWEPCDTGGSSACGQTTNDKGEL